MTEMNDIRVKLQNFSGPKIKNGETRSTLMCLDFFLKPGEEKTLRNQRMIILVDGLACPLLHPGIEWQGGQPFIWETGGTIKAVIDSRVKVIYL